MHVVVLLLLLLCVATSASAWCFFNAAGESTCEGKSDCRPGRTGIACTERCGSPRPVKPEPPAGDWTAYYPTVKKRVDEALDAAFANIDPFTLAEAARIVARFDFRVPPERQDAIKERFIDRIANWDAYVDAWVEGRRVRGVSVGWRRTGGADDRELPFFFRACRFAAKHAKAEMQRHGDVCFVYKPI